MEIPRFVECGMMTCLDDTSGCVEVPDVLVCCSIPEEDACVVIVVQFGASLAQCFHAYPRTKGLEVGYVWLSSIPCFVGCHFGGGVDESIVQVC